MPVKFRVDLVPEDPARTYCHDCGYLLGYGQETWTMTVTIEGVEDHREVFYFCGGKCLTAHLASAGVLLDTPTLYIKKEESLCR